VNDIPYFGLHVEFHCLECGFWFYDSEDGSGRVCCVNKMEKGPVIYVWDEEILGPDNEGSESQG